MSSWMCSCLLSVTNSLANGTESASPTTGLVSDTNDLALMGATLAKTTTVLCRYGFYLDVVMGSANIYHKFDTS